jgi:integrase
MAARKVMRKAGLSEHLQIMDMRRTGTMEMVDAGVPLPQIMAVTGHANPSSVKPYMKHTLTSAKNAATLRFSNTR